MLLCVKYDLRRILVDTECDKLATRLKIDTLRLAVGRQTTNIELKFDVAKLDVFTQATMSCSFHSYRSSY